MITDCGIVEPPSRDIVVDLVPTGFARRDKGYFAGMTITFDSPAGRTRPEGKLTVVDRWLDHVDVYEMTLEEYHSNVLWRAKRSAYAAAFPDIGCFICGRRDYQLHHRRYDNLGQEDWDELVPLCPDHHYEIEKHIGKGYPGVTRYNAHLYFVGRRSRASV